MPTYSREASSEQEVIYIGDSDEDNEPREMMSDFKSDMAFEDEREWSREPAQDNAPKGVGWGSGSEFEEAGQQGLPSLWNDSLPEQNEDNDSQEPDGHQSQGKESDDDEGGFIASHEALDGGEDRSPKVQRTLHLFS